MLPWADTLYKKYLYASHPEIHRGISLFDNWNHEGAFVYWLHKRVLIKLAKVTGKRA